MTRRRAHVLRVLMPIGVVSLLLAPRAIWGEDAQILMPVASSPASVAGLTLWYKANTLALNNTDPISSVTDWSGAGYTGSQGTPGYRPLFQTAVANGLPIMRFDGSDDALGFSSLSLSTSHTILVVANVAGGGGVSGTAVWLGGATTGAFYSHYRNTSDQWVYSVTSTAVTSNTDTYSTGFRVVTMVRSGTSVSWFKNGAALGSGTLASDWPQTLTGVGYAGTPKAFGDVAEVLIYTGALSTANRQRVERTLCQKYKITCS